MICTLVGETTATPLRPRDWRRSRSISSSEHIAGAPGLLIERRGFLDDGRAVEMTQSWYRGDAYDFVAELNAI